MSNEDALFRVGAWLRETGYRFVTVTPATHARVNARATAREANSLRDVFGWSRPFRRSLLPQSALALLEEGGALEHRGGLLRSTVRFSTLGNSLYVHSAYPTTDAEAVFFGPDTYRFAALIERTLAITRDTGIGSIVDIGCGAGAGGIVAAKALQNQSPQLILADINPTALRYARVNVALAAIPQVGFGQGDLFRAVAEPIDLIVANPPYLLDADARIYRHGGGELGSDLSVRIVVEGLPRLAAGGILILYTGAPIVDGKDTFREIVESTLRRADLHYEYEEIDPDVFGEELDHPAYARVERIAAVSLVVRKPKPATERRIASAGAHPEAST